MRQFSPSEAKGTIRSRYVVPTMTHEDLAKEVDELDKAIAAVSLDLAVLYLA
jgi:hypothetical protein